MTKMIDEQNPQEIVEEQKTSDETPVEEQTEVSETKKVSTRKEKKQVRKSKKLEKIKNNFFNPVDIKYRGPLSYRYLRILAWITLALGQLLILNSVSKLLTGWDAFSPTWQVVINIVSSLSTPFFIIASFGLILSNQKIYKNVLATYGAAFFGLGLGITLFYYRYVNVLFVKMGMGETLVIDLIKEFLGGKVQVNVFADLFAFACFHFFLNYTPHKKFKGKKIYIFRSFMAIPLLFVIGSYAVKVAISLNSIHIPFYIYPFLTTKSPIIFSVFVLACIWIKNRERIFIRLGATKEEYKEFLSTNRNSFSFSSQLSLIFLSSIVFEVILFIIIAIVYIGIKNVDPDGFLLVINAYECGQSSTLLLAIPFILLYSYTRNHKNKLIDIFIPIIGIGLVALVYIEGIYQLLISTLAA